MMFIEKIEKRIGKISIRNKFVIVYSFLLFAVALFIYLYFPAQLEQQELASVREKLISISELTAYSISPALHFSDRDAMDNSLIGLLRNKDIIYIVIKDDKANIVYSYNLDKTLPYENSKMNNYIRISDDATIIENIKTIFYNNNFLGKLVIGMSLNHVHESINDARRSIATISFITLLLGFILFYIISSLIVIPLNRLTSTIEEISKGDLSKRAVVTTEDEVGKLGTSFNSMLDKLEKAYKSLQEEIVVRKEVEEKLIKAKEDVSKALEQEKELSELRNKFISMVSHEYRTPLTAILSSTYLLEIFYKKGLTNEFEKQIKVIQSSVNDMNMLLEDVLTIGKLNANNKIEKDEVVDITEIIDEQIIITNVMDNSKHNIVFKNNLQNSIIKSNKKALIQIISNLLSNATKYSPVNTKIEVELSHNNSYISLSIKDEGIGIDKNDIEDIFEPFVRGSNVGIIQGTGLGLNIVKKTVDALGYAIFVESEIGKGSKFIILIP